MCYGGTGWAIEMAKLLKKVLYVYDVEGNIWFWYNHEQNLFYACDDMSEQQFAVPTLVSKTAIVGKETFMIFRMLYWNFKIPLNEVYIFL